MQRSSAFADQGTIERARRALGRRHNWLQLGKFCAVGASGYLVNLAVFAILVGSGLHYLLAATGLVPGRGHQQLHLEPSLDVPRPARPRRLPGPAVPRGLRSLALAANLVILHVLVQAMDREVLPQAIAIVLVTPLNFVGNKLWSFGLR